MAQKRSIFEEVGETRREAPAAAPKATDTGAARRAIAAWLKVLFVLVVVMIAVGGLTRLTDSGLSITEWRPVTGALPPLSAEAWEAEFEKYRAIPEYQLQNRGMSMAEFKVIYWWEWGHRQLGRVIGLVWGVGFLWFLLRGQIPRGWTPRLLGLGALGGLQGAIGWWMVSSGLTGTMLDVASYRLATHLGLAFVILGLIAWYVLRLGRDEVDILQARRQRQGGLVTLTSVMVPLLFVQILLGALVAGIDAGRTYVDWPLMSGQFLPPDPFYIEPVWSNFFENAGLVQFNHRMLAYAVFLFGLFVWWRARGSALAQVRLAFGWMMLALALQVVLGIITVLYVAPWHLAIGHQFLAVLLWVALLRARFEASYPRAQSVRA
ncbi:heme A synthase [Pontivivens ytuae]|uniref:Heme A synthase n=1 Tax=Pontivivens ytuae TaxID=2789856 RepID=A0A7S9QBV4_9RHOB|nr:heme A synthase [Pontivivens ytuae]QPH53553.1 COX15/CtaA family protein [Pontivivens ytuae]